MAISDTERVKNIVEKDSFGAIERVMSVVQSDITAMLNEFMHVQGFSVNVGGDGQGGYVIKMEIRADRFYEIGNTTEE